MLKNFKANTLLYVLILVNIALVMGVVVFNNSITITNNLNIGTNAEEVYRNIYDKGHIAIQSVHKFNSNGNGFDDIISCPTNVTMSGATYKVSGMTTEMAYEFGTIYCKGDYRGDEFRIYFNIDKTDYDSAYYKGDLVKLQYDVGSSTNELSTTNVGPDTSVVGTADYYGNPLDYSADNDTGTNYDSIKGDYHSYLEFTFPSSKYIGQVKIYKYWHSSWGWRGYYWDNLLITFYDDFGNVITNSTDSGVRAKTDIIIDCGSNCISTKTKKIRIESNNNDRRLDMREVYMYEYLTSNGSSPYWIGEREFNDSDDTLISFDDQGTGGGDKVDDDMNSDDYRGGSIEDGGVYTNYAFGYEDDDILPRKTFWGNIPVGYKYYNIFWNNFKTDTFIKDNPYNEIGYSEKIDTVGTGYIYIDTYNTDNTDNSIFDLKIIQFDKEAYKEQNTLLPLKSWEGKAIDNFLGYIQLSSTGNLSLSYYKSGNEFPFDFKDYDYSIFVTNKNDSGDISYILTAETESGTGIYINPINDSLTGTIEVMSNHMLMGGEKNFIGDNFVVVGAK